MPAVSELQKRLCAIWQDGLGIDEVGIQDNFIDLGGNSMRAMQIANRTRSEVTEDVGIRDVLLYPTVSEFESFLQKKARAGEG